jgi:hypothetical protein
MTRLWRDGVLATNGARIHSVAGRYGSIHKHLLALPYENNLSVARTTIQQK